MKKRRKLNRRGKLVIFLFSLVIGSLLFFNITKIYQTKQKIKIETTKSEEKEKIDTKKEKEEKISLIMVGDNLIHDKIYNEAKTSNGYDFTPFYKRIKNIVSNYDLAYYNQETILGGSEMGVSSYPAFNSPYEVGDAMLDAGFNLVSLATNHTLDRGEQAIINSRNYWNSKKEVLAVGSYSSKEEKNEIHILKKNNITYTLLNYTYGTNGIKVPTNKEYLVNIWPTSGTNPETDTNYQNYKETIKKDIEAVRDKVDLLLVAMHWGIEYEYTPNSYQKDMAKYLESLGVDIIIGTHPHVIQPIEWINNTLVIYSLGNFFSAHEVKNIGNRIGLMSSVDITKKNNKIEINNLKNELLYTYYTDNYHNFDIIPFKEINKEVLNNYQEVYEKFSNIVKSIDQKIEVNSLE